MGRKSKKKIQNENVANGLAYLLVIGGVVLLVKWLWEQLLSVWHWVMDILSPIIQFFS